MTRVVNKNFEEYDVYIGRGSKWGNPYSHVQSSYPTIKVDTREEAIECYALYLAESPDLLDSLEELQGKVLGCYCKPLACHGDVLVRMINESKRYRNR